jgi:hypothetical protein
MQRPSLSTINFVFITRNKIHGLIYNREKRENREIKQVMDNQVNFVLGERIIGEGSKNPEKKEKRET